MVIALVLLSVEREKPTWSLNRSRILKLDHHNK